jgi:hypothetical protein
MNFIVDDIGRMAIIAHGYADHSNRFRVQKGLVVQNDTSQDEKNIISD